MACKASALVHNLPKVQNLPIHVDYTKINGNLLAKKLDMRTRSQQKFSKRGSVPVDYPGAVIGGLHYQAFGYGLGAVCYFPFLFTFDSYFFAG